MDFSLDIFTGSMNLVLEEGLGIRGEEPDGIKWCLVLCSWCTEEADLVHDMRMIIVRMATLARIPLRLESQG